MISPALSNVYPFKSGVRRFIESDIPRVADLHRRVNGVTDEQAIGLSREYERFFRDVFVPQESATIGSDVYEERDGCISGFQGVRPRRMIFEDRPLVAAICSHFVVNPLRRGLPGIRLLKNLMGGAQDLTIADESSDAARRLWEWCGGSTALLYSIHWVRPLRVTESAVMVLLKRQSPRVVALSKPIARIVDAVSGRLRLHPLRTARPSGSTEELDEETMAARLADFTCRRTALRPDYSDGSLPWILRRASTRKAGGEFRKRAVKDDTGELAGWFVYFANRGGIGEVLQIAANAETAGLVLDHLIEDGRRNGVIALSGRLDPPFAHEMSERHCLFYRRGHWALIHSRSPRLLHAIERGDAFLSRLEGEWCLRFK